MAKFTCNFISYTLKRTVDITVVIPSPTIPDSMGMNGGGKPSHTPKEKYPVLYLLHGMGNNPMVGATVACAVAVYEGLK